MNTQLISRFHHWKERQAIAKESGSADLVAALVLTPIILMLFFAIIDISLWLNTKANIEANVRDGVRVASMWGGTGNKKQVRLNDTNKNIDTIVKDKLWDSSKGTCTRSNCTKAPVVKCRVGNINGSAVRAKKAGDKIACQVTYYYKSIFPGADLFGFGQITQKPISYTVDGLSETGYR